MDRIKLFINKDLLILCISLIGLTVLPPAGIPAALESTPVTISELDMDNPHRIIYITDLWKFMPGDDPEWARPGYDDSDWSYVSTYLSEIDLAFTEWDGTGWFRFHIHVDSTLANRPIALLAESHHGASEIYLNGKKLFELGRFSTDPSEFSPYFDQRPRVLVFPGAGTHLLAVRYANLQSGLFLDLKKYAGFRFQLGDADHHLTQYNNNSSKNSSLLLLFFLGGLLVFTAIHALIYGFNREEKRNLYFSLFTLFLALLIASLIFMQTVYSPVRSIYLFNLSQVFWVLTILLALRFVYSLYYRDTPIQLWLFSLFGTIIVIISWHNAQSIIFLRELFIFITVLEIIRVLVLIFAQKEKGAWIIGTGMLFFAVGILHRVSVNVEILDGDPVAGGIFGSSLMILSMSVFLSRDFALTQKRLGDKLQEVKVLSEKAIEQEKLNKEIEIESKLLEVEHNRKTRELEEARALQLSMLPRKMPDLPNMEVAVWMETATEVGGDYYDYHMGSDGSVTFVLGDATGHGLKAGIMVATAKSYFHTLAGDFDNLTILRKMSSGFRNLDLKLMFMGILLVRTDGIKTTITSAGMPPILWYRKNKKSVKRLVQKGLPLGTKIDYNYRCEEIHPSPGDLLLLMSDGLMELFDENRQLLGIEKIEQILDSSSDLNPSDIINQFKLLTAQWAGNSGNDDDITLMVIKVKPK